MGTAEFKAQESGLQYGRVYGRSLRCAWHHEAASDISAISGMRFRRSLRPFLLWAIYWPSSAREFKRKIGH